MKKYHLATFLVLLETLSSDAIFTTMEITVLLSAYYAFCIIRITQSTFEYSFVQTNIRIQPSSFGP